MESKKIPLFKIYWEDDDIIAVRNVIERGSYWCVGKEIQEFEDAIKDYLGVDYCVVFNSGGSALFSLFLAMKRLGYIKEGDKVLVPAFTFIATAYAPLWTNLRIDFTDVEFDRYGMDPNFLQEYLSENKDVKVIMPIHYGGMPCKIEEIKRITEDNNLILIEDAAESFGSKKNNKYVGTFGLAGMFSFCHNKVFTSSEGGCIVTNDRKLYEKLLLIRSYGREIGADKKYFGGYEPDYIELGYNFRMSSIQAALGLSQLRKVDKKIRMRRTVAERYNRELEKIENIVVPKENPNEYFVYQMYSIRVLNYRDELKQFLEKNGISTKIYFEPLYKKSVFKKRGFDPEKYTMVLKNTEILSKEILTLPLWETMTKEEQDYVIEKIKEFFETKER